MTFENFLLKRLDAFKIGGLVKFDFKGKSMTGKILTIGDSGLNVESNRKYYYIIRDREYSSWKVRNEINFSDIKSKK